MPASTKTKKFTVAQIKEHQLLIAKVIEQHQRESKGEHFTAVTPEEIEKKLKRVHSPMIVSQSWNSTTPGGTVNYSLGLYNPDPNQVVWLFAHVWVGAGNVDPTTGTFLQDVDMRFSTLTQPAFDGLKLGPCASATLNFALKVPATAEKTNYMGNSCLMQFNWHDIGTYLDRGVFVFGVS